MARVTTEVKTEGTGRWIASNIQRRRGYRPPKGGKLRKELKHGRKAFAGRYYQLLSGHAATRACLYGRVWGVPSDRCWWCGRDERQPTSLRQVRGVGPLDQNPIEGSGKGLWMETPPGPMD